MTHHSLVLLLALLAMCTVGHDCQKFTKFGTKCSLPVPAIAVLSQGIDRTQFDIAPLDREYQGLCKAILQMTCDRKRRLFSSKQVQNGRNFSIPDAIDVVTNLYELEKQSTIKMVKRVIDLKPSLGQSIFAKLGADKLIGGGMTKKFGWALKVLIEKDQYYAEASQSVKLFQAELRHPSHLELTEKFADAVSELPKLFNDSTARTYFEFMSAFGTDFASSAIFGGTIQLTAQMDHSSVTASNEALVMNKVNVMIKQAMASSQFTTNFILNTGDYNGNVNVQVRYYGGSEYVRSVKDTRQWFDSVGTVPHLLSVNLSPISQLITDSELSKQVDLAIEAKVVASQLDEIAQMIRFARNRLQRDNAPLALIKQTNSALAYAERHLQQLMVPKEVVSAAKAMLEEIVTMARESSVNIQL